jgi:Uma2 family endonuclease
MGMPATPGEAITIDEFFALPEDVGRRHELLDGVYVVTPAPTYRHQRAVVALYERLKPALVGRPDLVLSPVPGDFVLSPKSVVEPDLFVIPRPAVSSVHWRDVARPLLAVEVLSPGTARRDRGTEYWIVDLDSRLVERWTPEDDRPEILRERLVWRVSHSSELSEIDLAGFFAEVVDG